MLHFAGVWIDRKRAMILALGSDGRVVTNQHITFESRLSNRNTMSNVVPERGLEDRRNWLPPVNPKERYFGQVLSVLVHADRIAIFGPDSTKYDLDLLIRKREYLFEKVVGVQAVRNMDRQEFADFVREFYSLPRPGRQKPPQVRPQEDSMAAGA